MARTRPEPRSAWQALTLVGHRPGFHKMSPNQDDGDERFDNFDLWLGLDGSCTVHMLGHILELRAGRAILIPAGVTARQFTGPGQTLLMMWAHFDVRVAGRRITNARRHVDAAGLRLSLPGLPTIALVAELDAQALSEELYKARNRPNDDIEQLRLTIAHMQLIRQLRQTHLGLAGSTAEMRLQRATAFMEKHLHQHLALTDIARHVNVSAETLGRLFRTYYRTSPIQHLTRLRMARARELLQDRSMNVSEVARACGYASLQYFSRAFGKEYGLSPRAFRQRLPMIP